MQIGERLKEAREAKQLSLDRLQETTKIQKRYLMAIEQGNFDILPGTFYARAFVKEYALAVGLDPKSLLEEHKDEIPSSHDGTTEQYTRIQRSRRRTQSSSKSPAIFSLIPRIIVIILIIGIIFVAWTLYQKAIGGGPDPVTEQDSDAIIRNPADNDQDLIDDESEDDMEDESTDEESNDTDEEQNTQRDIELNIVEEGIGNVPESTVEANNIGDEVILAFETTERSWLAVTAQDGSTLYSQEFAADDSPMEIDISDENEVHLNIGNASQLNITINGQSLPYPVDANERVHQKIWLHLNKE